MIERIAQSAFALLVVFGVGVTITSHQAHASNGRRRWMGPLASRAGGSFPALPAAGGDTSFNVKATSSGATGLKFVAAKMPDYSIWQVSRSANAQRFSRWAAEALSARPSTLYIAGKTVAAVVGPELPPGTDANRIAALIGTKNIPVIGVGTGGMQVLAALDPRRFHSGPRPFTRAESAERDEKGLQSLYAAAAKDSPLADRPSVPLYPMGRVVALADAARFDPEHVLLRRFNEEATAIVAWNGKHAFWGPSDSEVLEPEQVDLYEALVGEVTKAGMPKKQWDNLVALAEEAAQAVDAVQKKDEAHVQTVTSVQPPPGNLAPPAQFAYPTKGVITSRFGSRFHPILHFVRPHNGVDIGAPIGQAVTASAPGIVHSSNGGGFGRHVVLVHGGGMTTVYGHLSAIDAPDGKQVAAGTPIGKVGNTGLSTGPHLHFELHQGGRPVDPAPKLQPLHFRFVR